MRNKLIPKRNKLTFLSVTFDIPKRDGHVRTYVHHGENTSRIMLPRANALGNYVAYIQYMYTSTELHIIDVDSNQTLILVHQQ